MALSNWDTMAFDSDGNPGSGELVLLDGSGASIYKNWLYLSHPGMWTERCRFTKPTIAQVHDGHITIGGMEIFASRHTDQGAIFVFIESFERGEDGQYKIGEDGCRVTAHMSGIGCYGFMNQVEYLAKCMPSKLEELNAKISPKHGENWQDKVDSEGSILGGGPLLWSFTILGDDGQFEDYDVEMVEEPDLGDLWCGVKPSTVKAFRDWLVGLKQHYVGREYIDKVVVTIDADKSLRFNQGDKFFVDHKPCFGELPATPAGESSDPIINSLIKRL